MSECEVTWLKLESLSQDGLQMPFRTLAKQFEAPTHGRDRPMKVYSSWRSFTAFSRATLRNTSSVIF
ncbi:MAG: hypothetical protein ACUVX8_19035, partial [Candidatus Zipacnadales bacterium]